MLPVRWTAEWRHDYANFALGGGNLAILLLGFQLHSHLGWQISFALVGLTSFWAWFANLKRYRTVADTPTSRIASAPQGYIELVGRGSQPPGDNLISPVNGLPCLWYRYRIERATTVTAGNTSNPEYRMTRSAWTTAAAAYWSIPTAPKF